MHRDSGRLLELPVRGEARGTRSLASATFVARAFVAPKLVRLLDVAPTVKGHSSS